MNVKEAETTMEKFDALMKAAEEFGTQAEQLAGIRGDYSQNLAALKTTNESLKAVIQKCNGYLDSVDSLISNDITNEVSKVALETKAVIDDCKNQCKKIADEYDQAVQSFQAEFAKVEDRQAKAERVIADVAAQADAAITSLKHNFELLEQAIIASLSKELTSSLQAVSDQINSGVKTLSSESQLRAAELSATTKAAIEQLENEYHKVETNTLEKLDTHSNSILSGVESAATKCIEAVEIAEKATADKITEAALSVTSDTKKGTGQIIAELQAEKQALSSEIIKLETQIDVISKAQAKQELFIKCGSVAAVIAAVAAIIGLFI